MIRLFVHDLSVMDFSYLDPVRGLLGESWRVDLELGGALDEQGMLWDFGEVKPAIKRFIDAAFDHRLLIPTQHPTLRLKTAGDQTSLILPLDCGGAIHHHGPSDALAMIDAPEITPDTVARAIEQGLPEMLSDNIADVTLKLVPEAISGAHYQYSHGLKQHAGNCQRIAHGHRSRIEIWRNDVRDDNLETLWSARWRDIYIGTRADLCETAMIDEERHLVFRYRSSQGEFELSLPERQCYLIDTDSTVENLAEHIATTLAAEHPGERIRVRAYEGINKGAIAESIT